MKCPTCRRPMELRDGKYGPFYFCPNQYKGCSQKTISHKAKPAPRVKENPHPISSQDYWDLENERQINYWADKHCACGADDFRIGGGGYCEKCGTTAR